MRRHIRELKIQVDSIRSLGEEAFTRSLVRAVSLSVF